MLPSSGLWICQFSHESLGEFTVVALFLVSWATCNYRANNSHDRGTWFIFGCAAAGCSSSRRPSARHLIAPESIVRREEGIGTSLYPSVLWLAGCFLMLVGRISIKEKRSTTPCHVISGKVPLREWEYFRRFSVRMTLTPHVVYLEGFTRDDAVPVIDKENCTTRVTSNG